MPASQCREPHEDQENVPVSAVAPKPDLHNGIPAMKDPVLPASSISIHEDQSIQFYRRFIASNSCNVQKRLTRHSPTIVGISNELGNAPQLLANSPFWSCLKLMEERSVSSSQTACNPVV